MFWKKSGLKTHFIRANRPYDFGYSLGQRTKRQIFAVTDFVKRNLEFETLQCRRAVAENLDFLAGKYTPLYDELRGLANGAGMDLNLVATLNFFEDSILKEGERCSLIVNLKDGGMLVGWNEDGHYLYDGKMSLVSGNLEGRSFWGLNYPGLLCGDTLSINSSGLIMAVQSLKPILGGEALGVGLPRGLAGRIFMKAESLEEVLFLVRDLNKDRILLHGFHLFCCDPSHERAISIEFHPKLAVPWSRTWEHHFFFAHTNHYQLMPGRNSNGQQRVSKSSLERLAYLEIFKKAPLFPEFLAEILSGHRFPNLFSQGEKICRDDGDTVTLHGQVLAVPCGGSPMLWTSSGRPDQDIFANWHSQKINFFQ